MSSARTPTITFEAEGSQPQGTSVQGDTVDLIYAGFALGEILGSDHTFLKLSLPAGVTVTGGLSSKDAAEGAPANARF